MTPYNEDQYDNTPMPDTPQPPSPPATDMNESLAENYEPEAKRLRTASSEEELK